MSIKDYALVKKSTLTALAESYRKKTDTTEPMTMEELATAYDELEVGGGENYLPALVDGSISAELTAKDLEGATQIKDYTFYKCENLVRVYLPDTIKTIGQNAFYNCYRLENIDIPEGVTSIGMNAYNSVGYYKSSIYKKVVIPDSVTSLGQQAFGSARINEVEIGEGITQIPTWCFTSSTIEKIKFGENITTIGDYAFSSTKLTSVVIPKKVTSITQYGMGVGETLTYVEFKGTPGALTNAFKNCTSSSLHFYVPWAEGDVAHAPWGATNATIHYGKTKYNLTVNTPFDVSLLFYTPEGVDNIYIRYPNLSTAELGVYGDKAATSFSANITAQGDSYTENGMDYVGYVWNGTITFTSTGTFSIYGKNASGELTHWYMFTVS